MSHPLPMIAALSGCLLLASVAAPVQPRADSSAASAPLARQLADETRRRLDDEFVEQSVGFRLRGARVWAAAQGLIRVRAEGTAEFGAEGSATTTVEAIYDPRTARWISLEYQLL